MSRDGSKRGRSWIDCLPSAANVAQGGKAAGRGSDLRGLKRTVPPPHRSPVGAGDGGRHVEAQRPRGSRLSPCDASLCARRVAARVRSRITDMPPAGPDAHRLRHAGFRPAAMTVRLWSKALGSSCGDLRRILERVLASAGVMCFMMERIAGALTVRARRFSSHSNHVEGEAAMRNCLVDRCGVWVLFYLVWANAADTRRYRRKKDLLGNDYNLVEPGGKVYNNVAGDGTCLSTRRGYNISNSPSGPFSGTARDSGGGIYSNIPVLVGTPNMQSAAALSALIRGLSMGGRGCRGRY